MAKHDGNVRRKKKRGEKKKGGGGGGKGEINMCSM